MGDLPSLTLARPHHRRQAGTPHAALHHDRRETRSPAAPAAQPRPPQAGVVHERGGRQRGRLPAFDDGGDDVRGQERSRSRRVTYEADTCSSAAIWGSVRAGGCVSRSWIVKARHSSRIRHGSVWVSGRAPGTTKRMLRPARVRTAGISRVIGRPDGAWSRRGVFNGTRSGLARSVSRACAPSISRVRRSAESPPARCRRGDRSSRPLAPGAASAWRAAWRG